MIVTRKRRNSSDSDKENEPKRTSPNQPRNTRPLRERNYHCATSLSRLPRESDNFFNLMGLPNVVRHHIMSVATFDELGRLALTSHESLQMVEEFVSSPKFRSTFIEQMIKGLMGLACCKRSCSNHLHFAKSRFQQLGILTKRLTIIRHTTKRISTAMTTFLAMSCGNITLSPMIASGWARFFHTFIRGWETQEWKSALSALCHFTSINSMTQILFQNQPGYDVMVEWELRLMFRRLILDEEIIRRRNDTFTSWLNAILSPHCIVNQAKLLYVIYGPTKQVGEIGCFFDQFIIDWNLPHTRVLATFQRAKLNYGDIASALSILYSSSEHTGRRLNIRSFTVISVLEEITNLSEPWLLDNLACLLLLVSPDLAVGFLLSRVLSGRVREVSWIVYYMCFVAYRLKMKTPLKIIYELYQGTLPCHQTSLITGIASAHCETVDDLRQNGASVNNDDLRVEMAFWSNLTVEIATYQHKLACEKQAVEE